MPRPRISAYFMINTSYQVVFRTVTDLTETVRVDESLELKNNGGRHGANSLNIVETSAADRHSFMAVRPEVRGRAHCSGDLSRYRPSAALARAEPAFHAWPTFSPMA